MFSICLMSFWIGSSVARGGMTRLTSETDPWKLAGTNLAFFLCTFFCVLNVNRERSDFEIKYKLQTLSPSSVCLKAPESSFKAPTLFFFLSFISLIHKACTAHIIHLTNVLECKHVFCVCLLKTQKGGSQESFTTICFQCVRRDKSRIWPR